MIDKKSIGKICAVAVCIAIVFTAVLTYYYCEYRSENGSKKTMTYESTIFDTSYVHSIDIVIDSADWEDMLQNADAEEYHVCDVVIDGNDYQNIAIRTKGNSSLSSVSGMGSDRYSFKLEFDHYQSGKSLDGLDKLTLNNVISDSTYMKDYLSYTLMREAGALAPLTSYINVTVNGEDFGLYLAVESIEEAFCERNFNGLDGELYKPDSMDINDRVAEFDPTEIAPLFSSQDSLNTQTDAKAHGSKRDGGMGNERNKMGGGFDGGMGGSSDVSLQYIDNDPSSYENIFNNAVFDVTDADKSRLIASIKQLNEGTELENVVDIDEVLSYFVVQSFVCNGDGYTGSLVHNYYLYESNGIMSMIAWDYNLAFGGMEGMGGKTTEGVEIDQATKSVNSPIDTPVTSGNMSDRPMINSLLSNEAYLERYHELYNAFIANMFESGHVAELIDSTRTLISDYVKTDATAFYTYDEFTAAVDTLKNFCSLRAQSIRGQLDGIYPATSSEQTYESGTYVDASGITISDMGAQNMGGGRGNNNGMPDMPQPFDGAFPGMPELASGTDAFKGGQNPPPQGFGQRESVATGEWLYYLIGSVILLAAGIIFAKCYKRKTW